MDVMASIIIAVDRNNNKKQTHRLGESKTVIKSHSKITYYIIN